MINIDKPFIEEYLKEVLDEDGIQLPSDISVEELAQAFAKYLESDVYEWLRDNYKSFFEEFIWDRIYGGALVTSEFIAEREFMCRSCHQEILLGERAIQITVGSGVFQFEHAHCWSGDSSSSG